MGAILSATRVLDRQLIHDFRILDEELGEVVAREMEEVARREKLYRGGAPTPESPNACSGTGSRKFPIRSQCGGWI